MKKVHNKKIKKEKNKKEKNAPKVKVNKTLTEREQKLERMRQINKEFEHRQNLSSDNQDSESSFVESSSSDEQETYSTFPEYVTTYLEFDEEYIGPMTFLNFIDNIDIMKYVKQVSTVKFCCTHESCEYSTS